VVLHHRVDPAQVIGAASRADVMAMAAVASVVTRAALRQRRGVLAVIVLVVLMA
jgi:hypothetical protein